MTGDGTLHYLFQMEVILGLRKDVSPTSDIVLQDVLVQWVGDLQPTNECECKDTLAAVIYFG